MAIKHNRLHFRELFDFPQERKREHGFPLSLFRSAEELRLNFQKLKVAYDQLLGYIPPAPAPVYNKSMISARYAKVGVLNRCFSS
jgi:hypothetical protein